MLEFLKVGLVIRQTEEGPMRTHLIMSAHRLTTFQYIKTDVSFQKRGWNEQGLREEWYCDNKGHRVPQHKRCGRRKRGNCWKEFESKSFKCGRVGHMLGDCKSKETNPFETDEVFSSETGCFDVVSMDMDAQSGQYRCPQPVTTALALHW